MRQTASRVLFDHWNSLRRGTIVPDRNDLDPTAIGPILQDVFILGADARGQWQYRVAGTRLSAFAHRELRDEPFEHWWRAVDRPDAKRLIGGLAQDSTPLVGGVTGAGSDHAKHDFELVLLPLRHGGRPQLRMLGGLFPSSATAGRFGLKIEDLGLLSIRTLGENTSGSRIFGQEPADLQASLERRRSFRVIEGGAMRSM
jgi:hypothetical protein